MKKTNHIWNYRFSLYEPDRLKSNVNQITKVRRITYNSIKEKSIINKGKFWEVLKSNDFY